MWSEASRSDPVTTRSLSGGVLTPLALPEATESIANSLSPLSLIFRLLSLLGWPGLYVSCTFPGVIPPSGPRPIFLYVQTSPDRHRGLVIGGHSGAWWEPFLPDGSAVPRLGCRGSDTFSTSRECPPNDTPPLHYAWSDTFRPGTRSTLSTLNLVVAAPYYSPTMPHLFSTARRLLS